MIVGIWYIYKYDYYLLTFIKLSLLKKLLLLLWTIKMTLNNEIVNWWVESWDSRVDVVSNEIGSMLSTEILYWAINSIVKDGNEFFVFQLNTFLKDLVEKNHKWGDPAFVLQQYAYMSWLIFKDERTLESKWRNPLNIENNFAIKREWNTVFIFNPENSEEVYQEIKLVAKDLEAKTFEIVEWKVVYPSDKNNVTDSESKKKKADPILFSLSDIKYDNKNRSRYPHGEDWLLWFWESDWDYKVSWIDLQNDLKVRLSCLFLERIWFKLWFLFDDDNQRAKIDENWKLSRDIEVNWELRKFDVIKELKRYFMSIKESYISPNFDSLVQSKELSLNIKGCGGRPNKSPTWEIMASCNIEFDVLDMNTNQVVAEYKFSIM